MFYLVRWGNGVPGVLKPPKSRKKRIQKKSKRNTLIRQNPPKPISIQKKNTLILLNPPNPRNPYQFERKNLYSTKIQSTNTKTKT